jgi:hypothetical protein
MGSFGIISVPFLLIIYIYYIIKRKKILISAGKKVGLFDIKNPNIFNKFSMIFNIILLLILFITLFTTKEWYLIIPVFTFSTLLVMIISHKLYSDINGIYENGIIRTGFTEWKEVHSYRWEDDETISLLFNDGERVDFKITDKERLIEVLKNNRIDENNS